MVGPTILLQSGRYFDFEAPEETPVTIGDIAHGLAHICRFTGQCHTFYSVAEHSILCSQRVAPKHAFAALMHDAAEAVMGDVSRPLKSLLPDYKKIERRVERAILAQFGLSADGNDHVKAADMEMLAHEQRLCMLNDHPWPGIAATGEPPNIQYLTPPEAYAAFLNRFHYLQGRD
ncbi:hypothetical protein [Cypionkella sinensis]|uniref:Phosphohydrolase n=1 Tax=Cypionkella sinensis TaxID=1756043 RepID=A0ABV7IYS9_9RHOB